MDNEMKKSGIPFKEFLEKTTNLFTIFGIFNGLLIYSSTIKNDNVTSFLIPSFFVLSILVWFEIIVFAMDSNNKTWKYEIFYCLACAIEIGLVWYFVSLFSIMLTTFAFIGVWMGLSYFLTKLIFYILKKKIVRFRENTRTTILYFIFLLSVIAIANLMIFAKPIIQPLTNKLSQKDTLKLQGNVPIKDSIKTKKNINMINDKLITRDSVKNKTKR